MAFRQIRNIKSKSSGSRLLSPKSRMARLRYVRREWREDCGDPLHLDRHLLPEAIPSSWRSTCSLFVTTIERLSKGLPS